MNPHAEETLAPVSLKSCQVEKKEKGRMSEEWAIKITYTRGGSRGYWVTPPSLEHPTKKYN